MAKKQHQGSGRKGKGKDKDKKHGDKKHTGKAAAKAAADPPAPVATPSRAPAAAVVAATGAPAERGRSSSSSGSGSASSSSSSYSYYEEGVEVTKRHYTRSGRPAAEIVADMIKRTAALRGDAIDLAEWRGLAKELAGEKQWTDQRTTLVATVHAEAVDPTAPAGSHTVHAVDLTTLSGEPLPRTFYPTKVTAVGVHNTTGRVQNVMLVGDHANMSGVISLTRGGESKFGGSDIPPGQHPSMSAVSLQVNQNAPGVAVHGLYGRGLDAAALRGIQEVDARTYKITAPAGVAHIGETPLGQAVLKFIDKTRSKAQIFTNTEMVVHNIGADDSEHQIATLLRDMKATADHNVMRTADMRAVVKPRSKVLSHAGAAAAAGNELFTTFHVEGYAVGVESAAGSAAAGPAGAAAAAQ